MASINLLVRAVLTHAVDRAFEMCIKSSTSMPDFSAWIENASDLWYSRRRMDVLQQVRTVFDEAPMPVSANISLNSEETGAVLITTHAARTLELITRTSQMSEIISRAAYVTPQNK